MNTLNEKMNMLFKNEGFTAEAKGITTVEEMQKLMAKYEVEMSEEEIHEMCRIIANQIEGEEELSENALDSVAGGFPGWWIAVGVVCVGAFAVGVYNGLKDD